MNRTSYENMLEYFYKTFGYDCFSFMNNNDMDNNEVILHEKVYNHVKNSLFKRVNKKFNIDQLPSFFYRDLTSEYECLYYTTKDKTIFDISYKLLDDLVNTNIDNVRTEFIRLPYRSMYINLSNKNNMTISSDYINSAFVIRRQYPNGALFRLTIFLVSSKTNGDGYIRTIDLYKGNVANVIEPQIKNEIIKMTSETNQSYTKIGVDQQIALVKLVLKIILYINSVNCNIANVMGFNLHGKLSKIKSSDKRQAIIKKYKGLSELPHRYVDTPITNYNTVSIGTTLTNGKTKAPHKVRGHFRNQPCGKKRQEIKTIWIEPYNTGGYDENNRRSYKVG